jgi:hypothetical protein
VKTVPIGRRVTVARCHSTFSPPDARLSDQLFCPFCLSRVITAEARENGNTQVVNDERGATLPAAPSSIRARYRASDPVEDDIRRRVEQDQMASQEPVLDVVRKPGQRRKDIGGHCGERFLVWVGAIYPIRELSGVIVHDSRPGVGVHFEKQNLPELHADDRRKNRASFGSPAGSTNPAGEPSMLWSLQMEDKLASCEIRFVPIGVEARVMRNGKLLYARTFKTGEEAMAWAEEERARMIAEGWVEIRVQASGETRLRL